MSRYFSRPRAVKSFYVEDDLYDGPIQHGTPQVDEHVATDTGLLDKFGDPIFRAPNPMGFGKDDEW